MIDRLFKTKSIRYAVLFIMAVLAVVSLLQGIKNAYEVSQDFQWDAAKVFSMRINPYDESSSMNPSGILSQYGYEKYYLQLEANQFPSLLILLLPFTLLKPLTARYVWIALNLVFTAIILYLLRRTFLSKLSNYSFAFLSLLMIAGTPYRNQLGVGQHTLFAFCFFLMAVYFSEFSKKRNSTLTAIALFICYFKYTLTIPLVLYFIYKKRYKEIAISSGVHVILTAVSAWWLNDTFLNMIIKPLKVSSALSADGGLDIMALFGGSGVGYVFTFLIMVMLIYLAFKLPPGYDNALFSVLIMWSLIITYHRTYDFFVIIAVEGMFSELYDKYLYEYEKCTDKINRLDIINLYYYVVMFCVFFVLRIFSENTASRISVGTIYYVLTFILTYILIKIFRDGEIYNNEQKIQTLKADT